VQSVEDVDGPFDMCIWEMLADTSQKASRADAARSEETDEDQAGRDCGVSGN